MYIYCVFCSVHSHAVCFLCILILITLACLLHTNIYPKSNAVYRIGLNKLYQGVMQTSQQENIVHWLCLLGMRERTPITDRYSV